MFSKIIISLINSPDTPKHYRSLMDYYSNNNKLEFSKAIKTLIEKKFSENIVSNNNSQQ